MIYDLHRRERESFPLTLTRPQRQAAPKGERENAPNVLKIFIAVLVSALVICHSSFAFEGRIAATLSRAGDAQNLIYTVGTNFLRIEQTDTNWPHARDIVNLQSGEITLLFPHNRSFVRLHTQAENSAMPPSPPAMPPPGAVGAAPQLTGGTPAPLPAPAPMPQMPPGVGPRPGAFGAPQNFAGGMPSPAMPAMPMMPMEKMELVATNGTTNILGFTCAHYELRQRGEVMEIWATEQLFPFQPYWENQPHRFGPRMIEEQWGRLAAEKKLFPLRAVLSFENGPERMRFEVTAITPEKIKPEDAAKLFGPPPEYMEIQPLPF